MLSALGQKQTYALQKRHVRFTPNSDRKSRHVREWSCLVTPNSGHVQCNSDVR